MQLGLIDVLNLLTVLLGVIAWVVLVTVYTKKLIRFRRASHHLGHGRWRIYGPLPVIPPNWLLRILAGLHALVLLFVVLQLIKYLAGLPTNTGWAVYGSFVVYVEVNGRRIIEQDYQLFLSGVFRAVAWVFMIAVIFYTVLRKFMESIWIMLPAQKLILRLGIYALNIPIVAYIYIAFMHRAAVQYFS